MTSSVWFFGIPKLLLFYISDEKTKPRKSLGQRFCRMASGKCTFTTFYIIVSELVLVIVLGSYYWASHLLAGTEAGFTTPSDADTYRYRYHLIRTRILIRFRIQVVYGSGSEMSANIRKGAAWQAGWRHNDDVDKKACTWWHASLKSLPIVLWSELG